MLLGLCGEQQFHISHVSLEIVACMLEVRAHSEVLTRLRLREPVLPLYVISLLLLGVKGRGDEPVLAPK